MERLLGERHATPTPFQQGRTGLPLQLGDLLGDGGGGVSECGGGARDGAVDGDGVQGAQPGQVEHRDLRASGKHKRCSIQP